MYDIHIKLGKLTDDDVMQMLVPPSMDLLEIFYILISVQNNTNSFDVLEQKREAPPGEKPEPVRTHLRNMIIVPEMIGSIIGVYNGKTFNQVEIKPEMIGHYLAEFSISYKPVKHGRPGIGATHSSRFIPLK